MSKDINELLGIDMPSEPIVAERKTDIVPRKEDKETDVDNDHDYSREAYYDLIQKGQEASASRYTGLAKKAAETQEKGIPDASGNIVPFNKGGLLNKPKRTPKKPRGKGLGNKK